MRLLLGFCVVLGTAVAAMAQPVYVYDLTDANKFDPKNPAQVAAAWDLCHAVATLQGNVNRQGPRLYVRYVEAHGRNCDEYWMKIMSAPGQWLAGRPQQPVADLESLVKLFRKDIRGAVVYDPNVAATSNLASTLAGVENLIAIRYNPTPGSVYHRLVVTGPKLPVVRSLVNADGSSVFTGKGTIPGTDLDSTGSAKCDVYMWMKVNLLDKGLVNAVTAGYFTDAYWCKVPEARLNHGHQLVNHDYIVSQRGWFMDLSPWDDETPVDDPDQKMGTDRETLKALLLSAYEQGGKEKMIYVAGFPQWEFKYTTHGKAGGRHDPVPTEWEYAKVLSAYNAFCDADAGHLATMANASFCQHYPLKKKYPQKWVTRKELRKRGYLTRDGQVDFKGRSFFVFYVGDWDAGGWVYQVLPSCWDQPGRGEIPLQWAVSPILERRAPHILEYLRRTATPNDFFVAADNGAGYLNPGMLQEPRPISGLPSGVDAWARHCKPYYQRWDVTVTGFIIDGFAPGLNEAGLDAYARFSPDGIAPQKCPPSLLHGEMPVLRADADLGDYADKAALIILDRASKRAVPFHSFRAILKDPRWYIEVYDRVKAEDSSIELLDAPTFWALYKIYLETTPAAARGEVPLYKEK